MAPMRGKKPFIRNLKLYRKFLNNFLNKPIFNEKYLKLALTKVYKSPISLEKTYFLLMPYKIKVKSDIELLKKDPNASIQTIEEYAMVNPDQEKVNCKKNNSAEIIESIQGEIKALKNKISKYENKLEKKSDTNKTNSKLPPVPGSISIKDVNKLINFSPPLIDLTLDDDVVEEKNQSNTNNYHNKEIPVIDLIEDNLIMNKNKFINDENNLILPPVQNVQFNDLSGFANGDFDQEIKQEIVDDLSYANSYNNEIYRFQQPMEYPQFISAEEMAVEKPTLSTVHPQKDLNFEQYPGIIEENVENIMTYPPRPPHFAAYPPYICYQPMLLPQNMYQQTSNNWPLIYYQ